jgi:phosphoglucosamine mutase
MSQRRYFGTDGIRGVAGQPPLTPGLVLRLGRAIARRFPGLVVVGRDTRRSSPALRDAISAGLLVDGADVIDLGVLPTPAVPTEALRRGAAAGVMITASHNPFRDNGIKVFGPAGDKVDDATEEALEAAVDGMDADEPGPGMGRWREDAAAARAAYLERLLPHGRHGEGLRVLVDAANGAASAFAGPALSACGAAVQVVADAPDGENINAGCGATHPETLAARVRAGGADLGVTLDGDADRCLMIDERGRTVDGDVLLALLALQRGADRLVGTVMSNEGVVQYLAGRGVRMHRAPVGDRNVLAMMRALGCELGGEESGHVIQLDRGPAGDGLATALAAIELRALTGRSLAELADDVPRYPAVKRAIRVAAKLPLAQVPALVDAMADADLALAGRGRQLLRYSGTEPVLRILVEGEDRQRVEQTCDRLARAAEAALGEEN